MSGSNCKSGVAHRIDIESRGRPAAGRPRCCARSLLRGGGGDGDKARRRGDCQIEKVILVHEDRRRGAALESILAEWVCTVILRIEHKDEAI